MADPRRSNGSGLTFLPLSLFETPQWLIEPVVRALRVFNTAVDTAFYDVPGLVSDLAERDAVVATMQGQEKLPSRIVDLDAVTNPEGSLLLIDTTTAPYVHRYDSVEMYVASPYPETRSVGLITVTGVGSSAVGAAAFGWQVSRVLGRPVLAIVPGYGLADIVQQALGGWLAFGLQDFLGVKPAVQDALAAISPEAAAIGRRLPLTINDREAPVFQHGSGSSDVLHALLSVRDLSFRALIGHSKGALVIKNAVRSLPEEVTRVLTVVTLGCPVRRELDGTAYRQFLGSMDVLGQLNAWFNWPDEWPCAMHTTNPDQLLPLKVADLLRRALGSNAG